jgi:hypothetical protein
LPRAVRRDVGRTAKKGVPYPDATTGATAERWARAYFASGWWNRCPGWLLPLVGLALAVVDAFLLTPLLSLGGVIVMVYGLLGWSTTRVARSILNVTDALPTPPE